MTITEIIKKYNIRIARDGKQLACDKRIGKDADAVAFVKANKQEIIDYINAEADAKRKAAEDRAAKIAAIEGLDEIRSAKADLESWHAEFNASFADVGCLGVRPKPQYDFDALYAKYPRAAAYLKAESFEYASNYAKSAAGKKAKERIINGEDWAYAIADMESEWKAHCEAHIWD